MFPIVVQSQSHVQPFATPWTAACQASLSFAVSWSLLKLMSVDSVMPSNISSPVTPFSSCPQSFPSSVFSTELDLLVFSNRADSASLETVEGHGLVLTSLIQLCCSSRVEFQSSSPFHPRFQMLAGCSPLLMSLPFLILIFIV